MKIKYFFQLLLLVWIIVSCNNLYAQYDTLRVMYYNILNYPEDGDPDREDEFRIINQYIKPDILLVNELTGAAGAQTLLDESLNVYGITHFQKAVFTNGPDTDNMLFYNSNKFVLYSQSYIPTALRNINEYVLYYKSANLASGEDTAFLFFYSAHLKATEGDSLFRLTEINEYHSRIDNIANAENIFFGGDLNLYTHEEPAYQVLINQGVYPLNDPLPAGDWHNNFSLRQYHTQSTRTVNFGGGATGGLDDRFDFILFSNDVVSGANKVIYVDNSCLAVGNDANHFNVALNNPPANSVVPDSVSTSLYYMSDHLPVICDIRIESPQGSANSNLVITEIMYNPPEAGLDSLEFIEIYNQGNVTDTLSGYYFSGVNFVFPELILDPGAFVVTAVNSSAMLNTFGINCLQWTAGALLNGSELILLHDLYGNVIDSVNYDDDLPWPPEADGNGASIMLCDPTLDNSIGGNWAASANFVTNNQAGNPVYATPGFSECGLPPIADFMAIPTEIIAGGSVQFNDISANNPDTWNWVFPGGNPGMSIDQNPIISYMAPGTYNVELTVSNAYGTNYLLMENYIEVSNEDPVLIITEVLQNPSAVSDTYGEWFEVYNPTTGDIDMLNWEITDNGVDNHLINSSVIVPANGFAVLGRSNNSTLNGDYNCTYQYSGFLLANGDDEIILLNPSGSEVDRIEYDGGTNWPDPTGSSMVFTGTATDDNNDSNLWTISSLREPTFSGTTGDKGSPGTNGEKQNIQQTGFELDIKVYLEGPFNSSAMETQLTALLPLSQPYDLSPWNYNGVETVPAIPGTGLVDWILVELRDASDISSAVTATILDRQSGFLRSDGSIVGLDGNSKLFFSSSVTNNLFVALYHRNHLSVISTFALSKTAGIYSYDFTSGIDQAYLNGQKEITPGIWGMISGDPDASGIIDIVDKTGFWETTSGKSGYLPYDLNLDKEVNHKDKNDYWLPNLGEGANIPD